jgi:hypothetical protein
MAHGHAYANCGAVLGTQRLAHPGKLGAEGIAFGCEPAIDAARL